MKSLINDLVKNAIKQYNLLYNPLGIVDDTVREINEFSLSEFNGLKGLYENLAAIYRYKFGKAQLEIIWDGTSHFDKYSNEWTSKFTKWSKELCENKSFIKGVIQMTVFSYKMNNTFFLENHLKAIVNEYFELKVLKINGHKKVFLKPDLQLNRAS